VAECDNGVLLSGGFQTGAVPVASPVTHFDCYEVTQGGLKPKIPVTVADRFGSYTPTLTEVHRLCAPADKNGEDPSAPANPNHETAYEVANSSPAGVGVGLEVQTGVGIFEGGGRGRGRPGGPTRKTPPPPPPPAVAGERHPPLCLPRRLERLGAGHQQHGRNGG